MRRCDLEFARAVGDQRPLPGKPCGAAPFFDSSSMYLRCLVAGARLSVGAVSDEHPATDSDKPKSSVSSNRPEGKRRAQSYMMGFLTVPR
jgi:hypothetical protein